MTGLEPARLATQDPKSCVYANFTTSAYFIVCPSRGGWRCCAEAATPESCISAKPASGENMALPFLSDRQLKGRKCIFEI